MATNGYIYVERDYDKFEGISLHWDGTLKHCGKKLLKYYNTIDKVNQLIGLGDLSQLGENIRTCVAYHRDNNRPWNENKPNVLTDDDFYYFCTDVSSIVFLFRNNKWYYTDNNVRAKYYKNNEMFKLLEMQECGLTTILIPLILK